MTSAFPLVDPIGRAKMAAPVGRKMGHAASEISTGNLDVPELEESGMDEMSRLAVVFNRMARSLKKGMQMVEGG